MKLVKLVMEGEENAMSLLDTIQTMLFKFEGSVEDTVAHEVESVDLNMHFIQLLYCLRTGVNSKMPRNYTTDAI